MRLRQRMAAEGAAQTSSEQVFIGRGFYRASQRMSCGITPLGICHQLVILIKSTFQVEALAVLTQARVDGQSWSWSQRRCGIEQDIVWDVVLCCAVPLPLHWKGAPKRPEVQEEEALRDCPHDARGRCGTALWCR